MNRAICRHPAPNCGSRRALRRCPRVGSADGTGLGSASGPNARCLFSAMGATITPKATTKAAEAIVAAGHRTELSAGSLREPPRRISRCRCAAGQQQPAQLWGRPRASTRCGRCAVERAPSAAPPPKTFLSYQRAFLRLRARLRAQRAQPMVRRGTAEAGTHGTERCAMGGATRPSPGWRIRRTGVFTGSS